MTTGELIEELRRVDPLGTMRVVLAVDAGEGYVGLRTVYGDQLRRQPVDGDELDCSSRETAVFLGDADAEVSPPAVFAVEGNEFDDPAEDCPVRTTFGRVAAGSEVAGLAPDDAEVLVHLTDNETTVGVSMMHKRCEFTKEFVNWSAVATALSRHLTRTLDSLEDSHTPGLRIVRITPKDR